MHLATVNIITVEVLRNVREYISISLLIGLLSRILLTAETIIPHAWPHASTGRIISTLLDVCDDHGSSFAAKSCFKIMVDAYPEQ